MGAEGSARRANRRLVSRDLTAARRTEGVHPSNQRRTRPLEQLCTLTLFAPSNASNSYWQTGRGSGLLDECPIPDGHIPSGARRGGTFFRAGTDAGRCRRWRSTGRSAPAASRWKRRHGTGSCPRRRHRSSRRSARCARAKRSRGVARRCWSGQAPGPEATRGSRRPGPASGAHFQAAGPGPRIFSKSPGAAASTPPELPVLPSTLRTRVMRPVIALTANRPFDRSCSGTMASVVA